MSPSFALKPRFSEAISIRYFNPALLLQNLSSVFPKNMLIYLHPARQGRCASSRVLGRDAVDALLSPDERQRRGRPRRVVLISRRWDQALRDVSQGDGG
jgi:hypothetical protein